MEEEKYLIEAKEVDKSFAGVHALDHVRFNLKGGEVHALLGENGAGKSTLVKILSGVYQMDSGEIWYDGKRLAFATPKMAQDWGMGIIHQELNLCPHLTVAQNIFIGREKRNGIVLNERAQNKAAKEILAMIGGEQINPAEKVGKLTVSKQQMVEIAKALSMNTRVLIMDEPTSSMSSREIDQLFDVILKLKKQGVGIIYISHRMEELKRIVDRVSIYRDGAYIATREFNEADMDLYIQMMVGRKLDQTYPRVEIAPGKVVFRAEHVSRGRMLKDCSFDLREGEILAFAGLDGAGRTALARAVFGADPVDTMDLYKNGRKLTVRNTQDAIGNGIVYAPEDRKKQGLAVKMTVMENITIASLDQALSRRYVISRKKETCFCEDMIERLRIKTPSLEQRVRNLSGGNQQKIVFAKWLLKDPDIFFFDEPTRGIDVGAKREIYRILNELKERKKAIVLISSELPEILGVSDRVLVMCEGRVQKILDTKETTQEEIMYYASMFRPESQEDQE